MNISHKRYATSPSLPKRNNNFEKICFYWRHEKKLICGVRYNCSDPFLRHITALQCRKKKETENRGARLLRLFANFISRNKFYKARVSQGVASFRGKLKLITSVASQNSLISFSLFRKFFFFFRSTSSKQNLFKQASGYGELSR